LIEGCRMLALWTAQWLDIAEHHPDQTVRSEANQRVALLTPVVKAFLTDCGSEVTNLGVQVFGGHGYIRANGQEQLVRDARITQIYEGTNGVQAMDLLGRKVLHDGGQAIGKFFIEVQANLTDTAPELAEPSREALSRLRRVTDFVMSRSAQNPEEVGAAAVAYLRLFALVALSYLYARATGIAEGHPSDPFYRAKLATGRFFVRQILPQAAGLEQAILAGAENAMALAEADF
jgi:butyryl-CoA dehydrogenase